MIKESFLGQTILLPTIIIIIIIQSIAKKVHLEYGVNVED